MAKAYPFLKRALDFLLSLGGLFALFPFFVLLVLLLVVDSPGPVFYVQERLTKGRKPFRILKFRSMVPGARDIQLAKGIHADVLVTRFGRFLRNTHFDEFPQLFNVLLGDMSLVGPRPLMPNWVEERARLNPLTLKRFEVKAGMAGIERLLFLLQDDKEKLAAFFPDLVPYLSGNDLGYLDSYYVRHLSFWLDLRIFWLTFYMSLKRLLFG